MKVYTKKGDQGQTALFGGRRVSKSHLRVDSYGTVDELNAFVGLLADQLKDKGTLLFLKEIQNRLFTLGAHLASDPEKQLASPDLLPEDISALEREMDRMDEELEPLKNFVLPGGSLPVSHAHVCRTICRRAERLVVALNEIETVEPAVLQYLNRLSDYFFVLSRYLAIQTGADEHIWAPRNKS